MPEYLKSYKQTQPQPPKLKGVVYTLTTERVILFGLIKREHTHQQIIPREHSTKEYLMHWNKLIKDKTKL